MPVPRLGKYGAQGNADPHAITAQQGRGERDATGRPQYALTVLLIQRHIRSPSLAVAT